MDREISYDGLYIYIYRREGGGYLGRERASERRDRQRESESKERKARERGSDEIVCQGCRVIKRVRNKSGLRYARGREEVWRRGRER